MASWNSAFRLLGHSFHCPLFVRLNRLLGLKRPCRTWVDARFYKNVAILQLLTVARKSHSAEFSWNPESGAE